MKKKRILQAGFFFILYFAVMYPLCFQKLCAEHCTACGAAHGIVGQSHELPVIDRVLSQTSYRDTHTVLIVDIQSDLRAVILLEILDKMLRCARKLLTPAEHR